MRFLLAKLAFLLALGGSISHASFIYDADFSTSSNLAGFSHFTPRPPGIGPRFLTIRNFSLSYQTTPSTDNTLNVFGLLQSLGPNTLASRDFGGEARFESEVIDVSGWNEVRFSAIGVTFGSDVFDDPEEYFEWFATMDGGTDIVSFRTRADGSLSHDLTIDVSSFTTMTVGFNFDIDDDSDGFNISSVQVEGITAAITAVPEPTSFVLVTLAGAGGLLVVRRKQQNLARVSSSPETH